MVLQRKLWFLWQTEMLTLFLLTSHFKRLLKLKLIHVFENTERVKGLSKIEFMKLLPHATKDWKFHFQWKALQVSLQSSYECPMLFSFILRIIGNKIVYQTLNLINTSVDDIFVIYLIRTSEVFKNFLNYSNTVFLTIVMQFLSI